MNCPRCQVALEAQKLHDVAVSICESCLGCLVEQRDLARLLSAMSQELRGRFSVDDPIEPIADAGGSLACPKCAAALENHGYMGSPLVRIDSCGACWVLWCDAEELRAMMALFTKTERRADDRAAEAKKDRPFEHAPGALGFEQPETSPPINAAQLRAARRRSRGQRRGSLMAELLGYLMHDPTDIVLFGKEGLFGGDE